MILNGNKFVKITHVFIPGDGCYFETKEIAQKEGLSPNGYGYWEKSIEFDGKKFWQCGNINQWD